MRTRSRELLAVGIFGRSSVGDRIETLLQRGRSFSARASVGRVAASAAVSLAFLIAGGLAPHWIAFAQQPDRPSFEVASIKPSDPKDRRFFVGTQPGGRFSSTNASLKLLIQVAYDVRNHQITGGPNWLDSGLYDIEAKPESAAPISADFSTTRLMLQSLLAERFKLAVHREAKEEQVYELVVAKGGPKFKETADAGKGDPPGLRMGRGQLAGTAVPLVMFTNTLSQVLSRLVIDKTGLSGKYDIKLEYTPDAAQAAAFGPPVPGTPSPDPNGPSIFTALQEQLGLRLESAKGPVDVLVIDRAEKPDVN